MANLLGGGFVVCEFRKLEQQSAAANHRRPSVRIPAVWSFQEPAQEQTGGDCHRGRAITSREPDRSMTPASRRLNALCRQRFRPIGGSAAMTGDRGRSEAAELASLAKH